MCRKYIGFIGGENYSTKFEDLVWSDCSANEYFFGIPGRGILIFRRPIGSQFYGLKSAVAMVLLEKKTSLHTMYLLFI